jgi:hypothetical protein
LLAPPLSTATWLPSATTWVGKLGVPTNTPTGVNWRPLGNSAVAAGVVAQAPRASSRRMAMFVAMDLRDMVATSGKDAKLPVRACRRMTNALRPPGFLFTIPQTCSGPPRARDRARA